MLDVFFTPNNTESVQIFRANSNATAVNGFSIWTKPRNSKYVYILAVGSGGGGGGGTAGTGTNRFGGGGGASGAISTLMIPSSTIPDVLYVSVGQGGTSGPSNTNGGAGATTYVSTQPNTNITCSLLSVNGGGGGAVSSGGGTAGSTTTSSTILLSYLGLYSNNAGIVGSAGGTSTGGSGTNANPTRFTNPGAGGGGSSSANASGDGGSISSVGSLPTIVGGVASGSINGNNGYQGLIPSEINVNFGGFFLGTGGSGGAGGGASTGGNGGNGAIGCGGGGGGAGTTGGSGGRGGDGLVIIISM